MMHEDRLFQNFKSGLENYSPEVPGAVYSGMRRKLWMSQFLKFNLTSLNAWYVGTALLAGVAGWVLNKHPNALAQQAIATRVHLVETSSIQGSVLECTSNHTAEHPANCGLKYAGTSSKCTKLEADKRTRSQAGPVVPVLPGASIQDVTVDPNFQVTEEKIIEPIAVVENHITIVPDQPAKPSTTKKKKTLFIDTFQKK